MPKNEKKEVVLSKELQEKLDKIGNTPIEEPELYEVFKRNDLEEIALKLFSEKELKKMDACEVGDFIHMARKKVTSLKNDDDTFKRTPNTENCNLPNFLQVAKIAKLAKKETDALIKMEEANREFQSSTEESDHKKLEKSLNKTTKALENETSSLKKECIKVSEVDEEVITEWERELVVAQVYSAVQDATKSSVGKR